MEKEVEEILEDLQHLEDFFNKDYITLETYYNIKNEILLKYIAIGEYYKSYVMEKIENEVRTDN